MKIYELYIILSPNLNEEDINNLSRQITSELEKAGFGVASSQIKQNERLTYDIKHFRQAHVLDIEISSVEDKTFPDELNKALLHNENILRHFVYTKSEKSSEKAKPFPSFDQIRQPKSERKSPSATEKPIEDQNDETQKKVDIEEVDKKLEELLK